MPINRTEFYDILRPKLVKNGFSQTQVDGFEAILNAWEAGADNIDLRCLAYMLATAWHETARTMQPVRETLADSDEVAIARLDRAFKRGRLGQVKTPYWRRDEAEKSWFGRGLVQLTHQRNYAKIGALIGLDLLTEPALALDMAVAIKILFTGMAQGAFTGHKLSDYFKPGHADWRGARRIINGTDRAARIATLAKNFHQAFV